jgi:hypothetical protein
VIVFLWGTQTGKDLDEHPGKRIRFARDDVPEAERDYESAVPGRGLNNLVERVPPVVPKATKESAVFSLNWLSATGTGILLAAILSGLIMGQGIETIFSVSSEDSREGALLAAHHRGHACHWHADALLRP